MDKILINDLLKIPDCDIGKTSLKLNVFNGNTDPLELHKRNPDKINICQMHFEPQMLSFEMFGMLGFNHSNEEEWDVWRKKCKVSERNNALAKAARDSLMEELEEILAGGLRGTKLFFSA